MKLKNYYTLICLFATIFTTNLTAQSYNLTGVFAHEWTLNNGWDMEDSLSFVYNQNGKKTSSTEYYGNYPFTGVWTPYNTTQYSYNNNGDVSVVLYLADNNGTLDTSSKETYTYNGNQQLTNVLTETYNMSWENFLQKFNDYDGNGNLIAEYYKSWDTTNSLWVNNFNKTTFAYDGSNFLIDKTLLNWDNNNSIYKNVSKNIYTNSGSGKPILTLNQIWNGVNAWYDMDKDSSIYDGNNKLIENYHRYRHQGGSDHWGMQYKETYTYTSSGKSSTYLTQPWDTTLLVFTNVDGGLITSTYDNNDNITKAITQPWDTLLGNWGHMQLETKYYYTPTNKNAVQNIANNLKSYPNPFSNTVSIELTENIVNASISIYDISGREVLIQTMSSAEGNKLIINTENLLPGVYLLQFNSGTTSTVEKITKMN
ncbi:MAG: T9SS type A sorting domain-containing protein [Bacteroidetes bacterium]|nr:T9SS type A sorting domain-containing protein [Bacteroidota bacterium]